MKIPHILTAACLAALVLPGSAQEPAPVLPQSDNAPTCEPTDEPDSSTGFSPEAMQEWQAIEQELIAQENNPEGLLDVLNANLQKDLKEETKQLLRAIKAQVLTQWLEEIFLTAETEADIRKAKKASTELVSLIDDDAERAAALAEVEQRFADPAAMLQQIQQARAEQESAGEETQDEPQPELTEEDYARISAIRTELEKISGADAQLEYLHKLLTSESEGVQSWIQPEMVHILLNEMQKVQDAGIETVDDLLKVKAIFGKVIHYCYPEAEKEAAKQQLEAQFADPEALLEQIKAQEAFMNATEEPSTEEEDYPAEV